MSYQFLFDLFVLCDAMGQLVDQMLEAMKQLAAARSEGDPELL